MTTRGRRTGRPHTIEIWFVHDGDSLYLMSGGGDRSDWVRNVMVDAAVTVRVGDEERRAQARIVDAGTTEDARVREDMVAKYEAPGTDELASWGRSALVVALDLDPAA